MSNFFSKSESPGGIGLDNFNPTNNTKAGEKLGALGAGLDFINVAVKTGSEMESQIPMVRCNIMQDDAGTTSVLVESVNQIADTWTGKKSSVLEQSSFQDSIIKIDNIEGYEVEGLLYPRVIRK